MDAVWRFLRSDLADANVEDAAIVQMGFNRSRIRRRVARWEEAVAHLRTQEQADVNWRRGDVGELFDAFSSGLDAGKRAKPLFGVHWDSEWNTPVSELRDRLSLDNQSTVGRGLRVVN